MMKKRVFAIICLLLMSFAFVNLVLAADAVGDQIDSGAKKVEQTFQDAEKIFSTETRQEFLQKQWVALLLTKPVIGDVMRWYMGIAPTTDPYFEFIVGVAPVWSWFFFLVLFIWIDAVRFYIVACQIVKENFEFSRLVSFIGGSALFVILIAIEGFQKFSLNLANQVLKLVGLWDNTWVRVGVSIAVFVAIVIFGVFTKEIKVWFFILKRKLRERMEETRRKAMDMRMDRASKKMEKAADITLAEYNKRAKEAFVEEDERSTKDEF